MTKIRSLLALDFDFSDATDASRVGHIVRKHGSLKLDREKKHLRFQGAGYVDVGKSDAMAQLDSFTIQVAFAPDSLRQAQQILEGESLPVSIRLDRDGRVIGAVYTDQGWQAVDSAAGTVGAGEEVHVRLIYARENTLKLEINDHRANEVQVQGKLKRRGEGPLVIGTKSDKRSDQFQGTIGSVRVFDGAIDAMGIALREKQALDLAETLRKHLDFSGIIRVEADPDAVDHRFDRIKAILSAAGVEDVSQLTEITIDRPTVIHPNTMMIAPRKTQTTSVDWGEVAVSIATANTAAAALHTAIALPNRNSRALLKGQIQGDGDGPKENGERDSQGSGALRTIMRPLSSLTRTRDTERAVLGDAGPQLTTRLPASETVGPRTRVLASLNAPRVGEIVRAEKRLEIADPGLFENLEEEQPAAWPVQAAPLFALTMATSIPINTSVIIAGRLDLTDQRLVIEPSVETLYIIAEEIVGDTNASITWRRPGGSTPSMADDPAKNGRSYSGVHTSSGSRNGLRGGDGLDGAPGITAQGGLDAPNLEVWVKHLTAMPDIDLNGEDGIKGGRGQRGGRGGNGARGASGEWWWCFGVRCWKSPGHGGNGGDGGRGGRGGPGGDGGRGGNVSIGVLEGTLASSVTARAFRIKDQGGQEGRGGDGGPGGYGGYGGTHGNDYVNGEEVCGNGVDGSHGAQGQPGPDGPDGREGQDGTLNFFEFTEESWNEQLTRPWLYELTPVQVFPGNNLTITGTRFADTDRVILDSYRLVPRTLADESIEITVPAAITGGEKELYIERFDGTQSNRLRCWVKPQLSPIVDPIMPGETVTLRGEAFLAGASVLYNGNAVVADAVTRTTCTFDVPSVGTGDTAEHSITLAVRNPDGLVSNERTVTIPRIIDTGFRVDVHGLSFPNFDQGSPSWDTFEETFGAFEVWHELLDPIFGHPMLTVAYYAFYCHFLKGEGNGGLATGFCTALSAKVLDEFWTGSTDTYSRITLNSATRAMFTAIHGRLLSRESLIDLHDQGRRGTANVATSFRRIEGNLRDGGDRESALLLFFVPSGAFWDEGYFDSLGDSHCIAPYRLVYPVGHDGTSIDGVALYCWDCNHPYDPSNDEARNCRLVFRSTDGEIRFDYYDGGSTTKFRSEDDVTLATMSNGKYLLSDHDMPFSGPFGLTTFVIDFLLSPADLLVENDLGQRTGLQAGSIIAEIPDSHPAYLVKGAYLLPANEALTRRITGNAAGNYDYHSIAPNGVSLSLEGISTDAGQVDVLAANADGTMIRFTPGVSKTFTLNLAREADGQARAVTITGVGGGPTTAMDLNLSPDLSVVRVSNTEGPRTVDVQVSQIVKETGANTQLNRNSVALPVDHDLVVTVTDWADLALTVRALPFS